MYKINCEQAYDIMCKNRVVTLDLRHKEDFLKGHIKGAVNINIHSVCKRIGEIANNKNIPIIVYCYNGSVSPACCMMLQDIGYENIYDLSSIQKWKYGINKL